jgi:hypothetical protein
MEGKMKVNTILYPEDGGKLASQKDKRRDEARRFQSRLDYLRVWICFKENTCCITL